MKIAFIGCGNMGEAILAGIHRSHTCFVCEPRPERQAVLKKKYRARFGMVSDAVKAADTVILAVKPQDLPDVLAEMKALPLKGKRIISIAAGVTTAAITQRLGTRAGAAVVRVMPNLPAMVGAGVSGICAGRSASAKDVAAARRIFATVGEVVVVPETMMDAVTAVSGSGPAYVFLFVESLMQAARRLGFSDNESRVLVYQTLVGSTKLLASSMETAQALRLKVTSKGGTTQAATDVFMKKDIAGMFTAALTAARDRARELSK